VTVQRLRQRYVQSAVQISEAEIDQQLASQKVGGQEVRVANLVITVGDGATPDQIAAAKAKIDDIRGQIERGQIDFRSAAIRYSQAQNALDGGEIGWRSLDTLPALLRRDLAQHEGRRDDRRSSAAPGASRSCSWRRRARRRRRRSPSTTPRTCWSRSPTWSASEQARQKAEALHARVVGGEDFAKVAKEGSDDTQTRAAGGDMGWFPADGWGTAVRAQIERCPTARSRRCSRATSVSTSSSALASREQDVTDENRRNAGTRSDRPAQGRRGLRALPAPAARRSLRGNPRRRGLMR
jgi:peptidyl-prolyl cis-trans isomerase SurA